MFSIQKVTLMFKIGDFEILVTLALKISSTEVEGNQILFNNFVTIFVLLNFVETYEK